MSRRDLLGGLGVALAGCTRPLRDRTKGERPLGGTPEPRWGVQSGDVGPNGAVIWARADLPSRLVVEWSTSPRFDVVKHLAGPQATEAADLTAKIALEGLPAATRIHYRARFEGERASTWIAGSFATAPIAEASDVVFAWSGDTNGQGWGIDPSRGGMPTYKALLDRA